MFICRILPRIFGYCCGWLRKLPFFFIIKIIYLFFFGLFMFYIYGLINIFGFGWYGYDYFFDWYNNW